jgi:hypothetical protein
MTRATGSKPSDITAIEPNRTDEMAPMMTAGQMMERRVRRRNSPSSNGLPSRRANRRLVSAAAATRPNGPRKMSGMRTAVKYSE